MINLFLQHPMQIQLQEFPNIADSFQKDGIGFDNPYKHSE
jgi:hypothetical protein